MQDYEYLLSTLDKIKGIGNKTVKLFYKKKIKTIFDLLWHLPISKIETSRTTNIKSLQIGKDQSIKIVKTELAKLKSILLNDSNLIFPKRFAKFKLFKNKRNTGRFNCIILPIDAVLKALKK